MIDGQFNFFTGHTNHHFLHDLEVVTEIKCMEGNVQKGLFSFKYDQTLKNKKVYIITATKQYCAYFYLSHYGSWRIGQ